MLNLSVNYKSNKHDITIDQSKTVGELKKEIMNLTKIPAMQQELSEMKNEKKSIFNDDQMPLKIAGITSDTKLAVKNLGKQIKWGYVFFIQYGGPLIIFPLLYLLGDRENYQLTQTLALIMAVLHYAKRQYETAFVHVFSRYSMPFKRVFINSIHYWVFFALFNGIEIFFFPSQKESCSMCQLGFVGVWLVAQFLNFQCHQVLSSFRKKKAKTDDNYSNASKNRGIPYGWGFNQVSCANYFWEMVGWLIFALITGSYTSWLFLGVSFYQMLDWAIKKHKNYKKQFGDSYPKNRKAMIPFII